MGAKCSGRAQAPAPNPYAGRTGQEKKYQRGEENGQREAGKVATATPTVEESVEKHLVAGKESPRRPDQYANCSEDEFFDGIPRYQRSSFRKSRSLRSTKVSEVGSFLGRVGSAGIGRAVEVLDTLGSGASLNIKGGFVSGTKTKNNQLCILAFEVANTIVKGSNLMQSISQRSVWQLKEVVLPAEGVQQLISKDMDELLRIVAGDKREELKVFVGEVVRFGNRCKDPQWHNLDRFLDKHGRNSTPQAQLRETAESVMLQLMASVQLIAELYRELHALDRLEENYRIKRLEALKLNDTQRGDRDNGLNILSMELKSQHKLVKNLKKKSLWSRSMEEAMEKLLDIVLFLNQEINQSFGTPGEPPENGTVINEQKLGPAGLALHYANIILLIDSIVARPNSMPFNARDSLYESLPPNLKHSLRSKMQSFHVKKELTVKEIKDEMEKTLHWLVAVATNTAKAHHGYGWVGEWATTGSELSRRTVATIDVMRIETLHHAGKQKTEAYILELLLWLNYFVSRCKTSARIGSTTRSSIGLPAASPSGLAGQPPVPNDTSNSPALTNQEQLQERACNASNLRHEQSNTEKLDSNEVRTGSIASVLISQTADAIHGV